MCNIDTLKNIASNILSTVMGIVLTLGIATLVDHQKDKMQAREMMFNIVKSAEDNIETLETYDSLRIAESKATLKILLANLVDGGLSNITEDSLSVRLRECYCCTKLANYSSRIDSYFYSAQLMHQFSNPEIYGYFAAYVEYSRKIDEDIASLHDEAVRISRICRSRQFQKDITTHELVQGMIDDGTLPDYNAYLMTVSCQTKIAGCRQFMDNMLLQMGATKEEYESYKKRNQIVDEDRVTNIKGKTSDNR